MEDENSQVHKVIREQKDKMGELQKRFAMGIDKVLTTVPSQSYDSPNKTEQHSPSPTRIIDGAKQGLGQGMPSGLKHQGTSKKEDLEQMSKKDKASLID